MQQRLLVGFLLGAMVGGIRMRSKSGQRKGKGEPAVPERKDYGGESLPEWPIIGLWDPDDFPHCHLSKSECHMKDMTEATLVYTDSDTSRCYNGEPFAFLVHPGSREKLLFYLPGGGACWDLPIALPGAAPLCFPSLGLGLSATGYGYGVMDVEQPDNVFRDFTVVSPPYCGGGAHVANTTIKGALGTYYQYDYNNNEFARAWFMKNLEQTLDSFVIMGSSAGSLGAALWSDFLLSTVKYQKATVLLDSYMGVFPTSKQNAQGQMLLGFEVCNLPIWKNFRESCEAGEATIQDIFDYVVEKYPSVAFAHLQPKTDLVQRAFYAAVALAYLDVKDPQILGSTFYKTTNTMMERYNRHPNYVTYIVDSSWHVFTPWSFWRSASTAGPADRAPSGTPMLAEWAAKLVAHEQVSSQCKGPMKPNGGSLLSGTDYCDEDLFPKTLHLPIHPPTPEPTEPPAKHCPLYCALRFCILSICKENCSFC